MAIRVGSVPYLNAKPLVDWFHSPDCDLDVEVTYAVPSRLAEMLRADALDVANVSIFEAFRNPGLTLMPGASISAVGEVKSVRLFSKAPVPQLTSVALDASSLTSTALVRILLREAFGVTPRYEDHPPMLEPMLASCDAALIIGDLRLFDLMPGTTVYDLGQGWHDLTRLPFVYAAWLARNDRVSDEIAAALAQARAWGVARLRELAQAWAVRLELPIARCRDYLESVLDYDLRTDQIEGMRLFQSKCYRHRLIDSIIPLRFYEKEGAPVGQADTALGG